MKAEAGGIRWLDASTHFIEHAKLKASTIRGYASLAKIIAESCLGDFCMTTLSETDIKAFIRERRAQKVVPHNKDDAEGKRNIQDPTIRRALSLMSSVYQWAQEQELPGYSRENKIAAYNRSGLRENKRVDRHLRPVQFEQALAALKRPEHKRMLIVLVGTGMRSAELLRLKWAEVDFERDNIEFGNSDPDMTKNGKARRIPMHPAVREALLAQWAAHKIAQKRGLKFANTPYCFAGRGGRQPRTSLKRLRMNVKTYAGLKSFRIHDLRHTFASWALQQGIDLVAVSRIMGHSDISTTAIYARHVDETIASQVQGMRLPATAQNTAQSVGF